MSDTPQPLSADILLSQKSCCGNGCRNCPYVDSHGRKNQKGSTQVAGRWQKWVIFDFDGTLADSFQLQKYALQTLAERYNWPLVTDEEFAKLREKSLKEILKSRRIPLWRVPFLMQEGQKIIANEWESVQLFAEIPEMLRALKQSDFQLGVLTSNTKDVVQTVLKNSGVRKEFSLVIAEPNLWGKHRRLQKLIQVHSWNPRIIWYVGDEVRDLEAAQKAGVQPLGVGWGFNSPQALQRTQSAVIQSPKELIHWVKQNT